MRQWAAVLQILPAHLNGKYQQAAEIIKQTTGWENLSISQSIHLSIYPKDG